MTTWQSASAGLTTVVFISEEYERLGNLPINEEHSYLFWHILVNSMARLRQHLHLKLSCKDDILSNLVVMLHIFQHCACTYNTDIIVNSWWNLWQAGVQGFIRYMNMKYIISAFNPFETSWILTWDLPWCVNKCISIK